MEHFFHYIFSIYLLIQAKNPMTVSNAISLTTDVEDYYYLQDRRPNVKTRCTIIVAVGRTHDTFFFFIFLFYFF